MDFTVSNIISNVVEWAYDNGQVLKGFTGTLAPLIVLVFSFAVAFWLASNLGRFLLLVALVSALICSIELGFKPGPPAPPSPPVAPA